MIVISGMPLQAYDRIPVVDRHGLPPPFEDYCTLWAWMTFTWVSPLIATGSKRALEEKDVWQISKMSRSRILLRKFSDTRGKTLLRRIAKANSRDLIIDFLLTLFSSVLAYASPFFLKQILGAIEAQDSAKPESGNTITISLPFTVQANGPATVSMETAYLFAIFAFVCAVLKSQLDLQHLYYGRRASVRVKSMLVSTLYEKALRKKDISGVINQKEGQGAEGKKDDQSAKKGAETDLASADVGKIVSLMAGDAQRVSLMIASIYMIYAAPIELMIATVFLYNLLGWSSFAGFAVMAIASPLQKILTGYQISLSRSTMAARDKRMGSTNELIQSIKFIKFFAWEKGWEERVLSARKRELRWMIKSGINGIMSMTLWTLTPAFVTAVSFSCYVLVAKEELNVSTAFTSIALFTMLRNPLNLLPMMITQMLTTFVSVQRIEKFLEEDEVPEWVCNNGTCVEGQKIGCEKATFRWHSAPKKAKDESSPSKPSVLKRFFPNFNKVQATEAPQVEVEVVTDEGEDQPFELVDITVHPPAGNITLVCGPTGSGKSSLLAALLGEMDVISGKVTLPKDPSRFDVASGLNGGVAYCAQQAWLESFSIKDNILFGHPYEEDRYKAVLDACCLIPDLKILPDGDLTEIGEKGVSLSGGQKARVALARTVYSRAGTVILDDILAAVDSHTARKLVDECLMGPLMRGRTVILVTHHVEMVLPCCAWVVMIEEGRIAAQGSPSQLRSQGSLAEVIHESESLKEVATGSAETETTKEGETAPSTTAEPAPPTNTEAVHKLVEDEKKATGSVKWKIYTTYLSAFSYTIAAFVILLLVLYKSADVVEKFWLSYWGSSYESKTAKARIYSLSSYEASSPVINFYSLSKDQFFSASSGDQDESKRFLPPANENVVPYLLIYMGIQLCTAAIWMVLSIIGFIGSVRAARSIFRQMLHTVVRSTSRFFDQTPSGRILNRFSKDIETVDSSVYGNLRQILSYIISLFTAVAVMAYAIPIYTLPAMVFAYIYWIFASGYVRTGRDLQRLESVTRSPIFQSFSELLSGIVTVRAFGAQERFKETLLHRLDRTQSCWNLFWMSNRWLLVRFDVLGAVSVLLASFTSLSGSIPAGLAGIAITQAQAYVMSMYWLCRFWTLMETDLNSVERVHEYLDLPQEPPAIVEEYRPPTNWPSSNGSGVKVDNLVLRYAPDLEPVLRGVSFEIKAKEKVGLVGRTGSGKSTMALAFFRFVEFSEGKIEIDGLDISKMGLQDLRSRLTIIPQDAALFSGTIRDNLDPFNQYTDEECMDALQKAQLKTAPTAVQSLANSRAPSIKGGVVEDHLKADRHLVASTTEANASSSVTPSQLQQRNYVTLSSQVSEGGGNFSQGQRQLIAMARALLRGSKLIIMDEATASVDFSTDKAIQETIRQGFSDSILITIAHRIRTVVDYDKILVLDQGKVVEFGSPDQLMANEDGIFTSMCKKSGEWKELWSLANEAAAARRRSD
ncbi:P-loop containing nucleoside triphosphate hydrolase protein [Violaceomyces palustris]|uniref:P-loop containing nucleoside triphosphate hydrolase protein n=1 Tax=Violaceomyces palustris TaxID=1673888 RepID=A0ACD0NYR1_9BASI|nr:P-loop containing nucleoside triphosphate hydrolase protein [Violaceomyces palustris]